MRWEGNPLGAEVFCDRKTATSQRAVGRHEMHGGKDRTSLDPVVGQSAHDLVPCGGNIGIEHDGIHPIGVAVTPLRLWPASAIAENRQILVVPGGHFCSRLQKVVDERSIWATPRAAWRFVIR